MLRRRRDGALVRDMRSRRTPQRRSASLKAKQSRRWIRVAGLQWLDTAQTGAISPVSLGADGVSLELGKAGGVGTDWALPIAAVVTGIPDE